MQIDMIYGIYVNFLNYNVKKKIINSLKKIIFLHNFLHLSSSFNISITYNTQPLESNYFYFCGIICTVFYKN